MDITPESLETQGYELNCRFRHEELVPFLQEAMRVKTFVAISYFIINTFFFGLAGFLLVVDYKMPEYSLASRISHLGYGIVLCFLLIPIHEYLHVLAYRWQGAKHTTVQSNWKKFYFMAIAHHFVANKKEFTVVALVPFVVITSILTVTYFWVPADWNFTILGMLIFHTAACSGDFALINFFQANKTKQLVTYDDADNKMTYFYQIKAF